MIRRQQSHAAVVYRSITDVCLESPTLQHLLMSAASSRTITRAPETQRRHVFICKRYSLFFHSAAKAKTKLTQFWDCVGGRTGECCFPGVRKNQRTTVPCPQGSAPGFCAPLLRLCVNGSDDTFNER